MKACIFVFSRAAVAMQLNFKAVEICSRLETSVAYKADATSLLLCVQRINHPVLAAYLSNKVLGAFLYWPRGSSISISTTGAGQQQQQQQQQHMQSRLPKSTRWLLSVICRWQLLMIAEVLRLNVTMHNKTVS
jgi:hypothetical protein